MKVSAWWVCALLTLAACGDDGAGNPTHGAGNAGGNDGGNAGTSGDDGGAGHVDDASVFERPDSGAQYTPEVGSCGFDAPAFCDNFEDGPAQSSGRSGELNETRWSGVRGGPWSPPNLDDGYKVGPALLPACRDNLPRTVLPDSDALICDPIEAIPTRHALISAASQNYGLTTYRIRQPFDFADRTGTVKLDAELVNNSLGGWSSIAISGDPSPTPSFDWEERGSGPRNGFEIEFSSGCSGTPNTVQAGLFTFVDYVQRAHRQTGDCSMPHTTTARDRLNHVEIYLSRDHVEVWASEPSVDGRTFDNFQLLLEADLDLPFSRGYVSLIVRNHATMKYWAGSAALQRFDNVGFDGPLINTTREHSVPDSLDVIEGLDGCMVDGSCMWRGDVIDEHPDDNTRCNPEVNCTYDGEARTVGYVVPRADEAPLSITIPNVDLSNATRARLALAAAYPWFDWNNVSMPPTALSLHYRLNGGPWHDRFINAIEENAFTDFSPELGGAGHGAGLLNQLIDLDLSELQNGTNTLEIQSAGTWTGEYRVGILGLDLILDTE